MKITVTITHEDVMPISDYIKELDKKNLTLPDLQDYYQTLYSEYAKFAHSSAPIKINVDVSITD